METTTQKTEKKEAGEMNPYFSIKTQVMESGNHVKLIWNDITMNRIFSRMGN